MEKAFIFSNINDWLGSVVVKVRVSQQYYINSKTAIFL